MQAKVLTVFAINFSVMLLLYFAGVRRLALPVLAKRLLLLAFMVAPVFIAIKGVESVMFASDLIGPVLMFVALKRWHDADPRIKSLRKLLLLLLLLWPLLMTVLAQGAGEGTHFGMRELQGLVIWIYRNAVLFSVFVLASSLRLSQQQFRQLLLGFLVLSIGMVALAAVNYLHIYNLAIFEELLSSFQTLDESSYKTAGTAWGFGYLGMFRGSMGQWYANSALLAVAAFMALRGMARMLALMIALASVVLVLISLSRAGLVATAISIFVYALLLGFRGWRLLLLGAVCGVALLPLFEVEMLQQRIDSIFGYASSKEANRVDGWQLALSHFSDSAVDLLIGVGATNRERVFHIIGAFGAHNEYIDSVFRAGIGGVLLLLAFLATALRQGTRNYLQAGQADAKVIAAITPALLVSNAVLGITQDHLYRDYSSYATGPMMYLLYGVLLSLQLRPPSRHPVATTKSGTVLQLNFA